MSRQNCGGSQTPTVLSFFQKQKKHRGQGGRHMTRGGSCAQEWLCPRVAYRIYSSCKSILHTIEEHVLLDGEPLLQLLAATIHQSSAYHSVYLASSHYYTAKRGRQLSRYLSRYRLRSTFLILSYSKVTFFLLLLRPASRRLLQCMPHFSFFPPLFVSCH